MLKKVIKTILLGNTLYAIFIIYIYKYLKQYIKKEYCTEKINKD